jgi:hypothetical protein
MIVLRPATNWAETEQTELKARSALEPLGRGQTQLARQLRGVATSQSICPPAELDTSFADAASRSTAFIATQA